MSFAAFVAVELDDERTCCTQDLQLRPLPFSRDELDSFRRQSRSEEVRGLRLGRPDRR